MNARLPGIGAHHSANPQTDEWLTPPWVITALGPFDLDPCSPLDRPWDTAARHYTVSDDGLLLPWDGLVWCNPPYSSADTWMARLAEHGTGIALVFARTETRWWFASVWGKASALLFIQGRLTFHRPDGTPAKQGHNAGGPSVAIAYGPAAADRLADAVACGSLPGALVTAHQVRP